MYLIHSDDNKHVSNDAVEEFEKMVLADSRIKRISSFPHYLFVLKKGIAKFLRFLNIEYKVRNNRDNKVFNNHYFKIMMGLDDYGVKPYFLLSSKIKSVYLFDAWPKDYDKIVYFCKQYMVDYLFVSAQQSANYIQSKVEKTIVKWIPEGINPKEYFYYSLSQKNIDVITIGRKYDKYHNLIVDSLKDSGFVYLYEKKKGELIFETRADYLDGIARSKISICIPSNITHPDRSGDVSTMTLRYLQSMLSKCLIVGIAPQELIELFGYNPVVTIDMNNAAAQICELINNIETYKELIEKNYQTVISNHKWSNRWEQMINVWEKK